MNAAHIPLSLYIHIPWCVQKCPYCDFNSHALKGNIPEAEYVDALVQDLREDLAFFPSAKVRKLSSIFIGGGTPSLFQAKTIKNLLERINNEIDFSDNIEITMEANPGSMEAKRFEDFQQAGVTRLSIGVQSFNNEQLVKLGRIHNSDEAIRAINFAKQAHLQSINIDLMHGLPNQTLAQAMSDLEQAIALEPTHLSWYQLTIEPNTLYYSHPPRLPEDDDLWQIFDQGKKVLAQAGYVQYETSGYSKVNFQCQHNLNYWRFGDYLGIGCGAHGKITQNNQITRTVKVKHPRGYLDSNYPFTSSRHTVAQNELAFEFFMNRFRLIEPCPKKDFSARTGLTLASISAPMNRVISQDYVKESEHHWQVTEKGRLFLNDLLSEFLE